MEIYIDKLCYSGDDQIMHCGERRIGICELYMTVGLLLLIVGILRFIRNKKNCCLATVKYISANEKVSNFTKSLTSEQKEFLSSSGYLFYIVCACIIV